MSYTPAHRMEFIIHFMELTIKLDGASSGIDIIMIKDQIIEHVTKYEEQIKE